MTDSNKQIIKMRDDFMERILKSPFPMSEHFSNIEKEVSTDYKGREVWEMLQNAYQAFDPETNNLIKIVLHGNILDIYNNGAIFPIFEGGINNLMVSHTTKKGDIYFSNKGLGFRSLLNVSNEIYIYSGDISVVYSKERAKLFFEKNGINGYFSMLSVPFATAPISIDTTTCIRVILNDEAVSHIKEQLSEITVETIVFLRRLEQLEVTIDMKTKIFCRGFKKGVINIVEEMKVGSELLKRINHRYHSVEFQDEPDRIDIMLAYNESIEAKQNHLYSYFKTGEKFPFGFLVNANFALSQNRNNLAPNNPHNIRLARKIVDIMMNYNDKSFKKKPWQRFKTITTDSIDNLCNYFDSKQENFSFVEYYRSQIVNQKIVPNVFGDFITMNEAVIYDDDTFNKLLTKSFKHLAMYDSNLVEFKKIISNISDNEHSDFSYSTLNKYLASLDFSKWKDSDRIDLLISINKHYGDEINGFYPPLFMSNKGKYVTNERLFTKPKRNYNLDFLVCNFISEKDTLLLIKKLSLERSERFYQNPTIKQLDIKEYAIDRLIPMAKEQIINSNNKEWLRQYIRWIFKEDYKKNTDENETQAPTILVLTRGGKIRNSKEVFLGSDYGGSKLNEIFYSVTDQLLAPLIELGIVESERDKFINFMKRFLDAEPKIYIEKFTSENFIDIKKSYMSFVVNKVHFPINWSFRKNNTIPDIRHFPMDDFVKNNNANYSANWIANFDNILDSASTHDILSLILENESLLSTASRWLTYPRYGGNGTITTNDTITRFLLKTQKWVDINGEKFSPTQVILDERVGRLLYPKYIGISRDNLFAEYEFISDDAKNNLLTNLGIAKSITSLSISTIYEFLINLSNDSILGPQYISSFYNLIMKHSFERSPSELERQPFLENDKIYCKHGKGFLPVLGVKYANDLYNDKYLRMYDLIDIEKDQGAEKAERWFGVNKLHIEHYINPNEIEIHHINDVFEESLKLIKVAFLALNWEGFTDENRINSLKNSRIYLCDKVGITFDLNSKLLDEYEFSSSKEKPLNYYLMIPKTLGSNYRSDIRTSYAVTEIMMLQANLQRDVYRNSLESIFPRGDKQLKEIVDLKQIDNSRWNEAFNIIFGQDDPKVIEQKNNVVEYAKLRDDLECKYRINLYYSLQDKSVAEQEKYISHISNYLSSKYDNNDLLPCKNVLYSNFPILRGNNDFIDINEIAISCKKQLELKFSSSLEELSAFLRKPENDSLLRFNRGDYLCDEFKKHLMEASQERENPNNNIEQTAIEGDGTITFVTPPPSTNGGRTGSHKGGFKNDPREDIGSSAEKNVLKYIREKYNVEPKWVSHFARENNVNIEGSDHIGYDMTFSYDGVERLVEVKSTVNQFEAVVDISENEYKTAILAENIDRYYIFFVTEMRTNQPKVYELLLKDLELVPAGYRVKLRVNKKEQ